MRAPYLQAASKCVKVAYSYSDAHDVAERHRDRRRRTRCQVCRDGLVFSAYRCTADPKHFHVGHTMARRWM